eukprot:6472635-Amphidinium_carterae.1
MMRRKLVGCLRLTCRDDQLTYFPIVTKRRNFRLTCRGSVLIKRKQIVRLEVGGIKMLMSWNVHDVRNRAQVLPELEVQGGTSEAPR